MSQFVVTGPSEVSLLPDGIALIHTDYEGDSLFVTASPSGAFPPAVHVGIPGHTYAVLMPTDPAELDDLLARVRAAVLAAASRGNRTEEGA